MYRWTPGGPRTRLLELRGQAEQRRFVAKTPGYLHSHRKPVGAPMQRERDGRLAGHVEYRREGHVGKNLPRPIHRGHPFAILIQLT